MNPIHRSRLVPMLESHVTNPTRPANARTCVWRLLGTVCLALVPPLAMAGEPAGPLSTPGRNSLVRGQTNSSSTPVTLPAQTEFPVKILSGLHSRVSHVGDPVAADLCQPVYFRGELALPVDTLLFGRVTRVRPARRFHQPAELTIRFERAVLPDGETEPIRAVLVALDSARQLGTHLDAEGYLKGATPLTWKSLGIRLLPLGALATLKVALPHTAAASLSLPVGGAGVLAYLLIWPKGNEVHVPPGTPCRIRLIYPLTVHAVT